MPDTEALLSPAGEVDVSVLLVTCNHENFVAAAIQSVLDQQTSRGFELIISEDASTDGTRGIVENFAREDDRVRTLFSTRNLKTNEPVMRALDAARGRYVCLLDGDDYWSVTDKIERQAQLLDENPGIAGCFHNALVLVGDASEPDGRRWTAPSQSQRTSFGELWEGNPFATCAGMLRRTALSQIGSWYVDSQPKLFTDWPLYLLAAELGDLLFVDDPVGVYRLHEGGRCGGLVERDKLQLIAHFYRQMGEVEGSRWAEMARIGGSLFFADQARRFIRERDKASALTCARLALQAGGVGRSVPWRTWLGLVRRSLV